jgi:hypothetical protein
LRTELEYPVTCEKVIVGEKDKEQTDYRKPSWSKTLACCSVALALPSPSDWLMRCHRRRGVSALNQHVHWSSGHAVTRRAIFREYPGHPYWPGLSRLFAASLPTRQLEKLFHLELHDTEQIELRNHNGALLYCCTERPNDLCETSSPKSCGCAPKRTVFD